MKRIAVFATAMILMGSLAQAQTKTTQLLDENSDGLSLYFYKNTLKMLNQTDNKEFDEMVKDIEKMRFIMIDRNTEKFTDEKYKKLKSDYAKEKYEEIMTSRFDGRKFDIYVREVDGNVKGTVILASDSTQLFVLDILGKVALDKAGSLFKTIGENSDVSKKIKDFVDID